MTQLIARRELLKLLGATAATSLAASRQGAAQGPAAATTHTYKSVGDCEIKADVFGPGPDQPAKQPVVIWIHGGGLISGSRTGVPRFLRELSQGSAGCTVVSIDYRLAPNTKLPAIIEDL
jgi:acetyl esterase/lipase